MFDDGLLVRRDQLPLPAAYAAPRTQIEERLAVMWSSVLSMDRVGVDDLYNDLGGDSFLATVISQKINAAFGVEITLTTLFENPTVAQLAKYLEGLPGIAVP